MASDRSVTTLHLNKSKLALGPIVVVAEGEEHPRPVFNREVLLLAQNSLVDDETIQIMNGLFKEVWAGKNVISENHAAELPFSACLFAICVAGIAGMIHNRFLLDICRCTCPK